MHFYTNTIDNGMEEVERVRFGFVNGANNFSLHYDEQESQRSVYPSGENAQY